MTFQALLGLNNMKKKNNLKKTSTLRSREEGAQLIAKVLKSDRSGLFLLIQVNIVFLENTLPSKLVYPELQVR